MITRDFEGGMGQAVAERTILRPGENWGAVAERVAAGNCLLHPTGKDDRKLFEDHLRQATILMSGRHLQHGDTNQPFRNLEVFSNCSTSATSFLLFYLLLNGSGVGRCYDDDMMLVNWDNMPTVRCVIREDHPDYEFTMESARDARHKYGKGDSVHWFEVPDSREGWAQALELLEVMTFQKAYRDDLLVLDFSKVRERGAAIAGMQNRPSSGPVPLMHAIHKIATLKGAGMKPWLQAMYVDHYVAEPVLVGGARRAARMAVKYWKDKSVLDFIQIKRPIEYEGLTMDDVMGYEGPRPFAFLWSSNNSVGVDSEYWELLALEPDDKAYNSALARHAREVHRLVTECSYGDGTGEPGLLNLDQLTQKEAGRESLFDGSFVGSQRYQVQDETRIYLSGIAKRAAKKALWTIVNPCVTGDTWVATDSGPRQVRDLIDRPFNAMVNGKSYRATGFWKTGNKPVFHIDTQRGYSVRATADHKILTQRGWVKTAELQLGDELILSDNRGAEFQFNETAFEDGWIVGQVLGDGGYNPAKYPTYVRFWGETRQAMAEIASRVAKRHQVVAPVPHEKIGDGNIVTLKARGFDNLVEPYLETGTKDILPELEKASKSIVAGFLRGWFDADGSVQGNLIKGVSVRLWSVNLDNLKTAQRMLARFGILSTVYEQRVSSHGKMMPDGKGGEKLYRVQDQHELVISCSSVPLYAERIGFFEPTKSQRLCGVENARKRQPNAEHFTSKVTSVTADGVEAVYDCTVEEVHRFDANAIIVHNCGEIPLALYGGYCVIADLVPFHADDLSQVLQSGALAARALIRVNLMDNLYKRETQRTNRIGVGQTGVHEFAWKFFQVGFRDLVNPDFNSYRAFAEVQDPALTHEHIIEAARQHGEPGIRAAAFWEFEGCFSRSVMRSAFAYSDAIGVNRPHTVTTIKPAGTTSKLFGLSEGWHLPALAHYLRWVQFREDDPLVDEYEAKGYAVRRDLKTYRGHAIVGFPTEPTIATLGMGQALVLAGDASPSEQYSWLRLGEFFWIEGGCVADYIDHGIARPGEERHGGQISYTLKYKPQETAFEEFESTLRIHQSSIRACSVMPQADTSAYEYLPEQAVSKAEYEQALRAIKEAVEEEIDREHIDCSSGACPIDFKDRAAAA